MAVAGSKFYALPAIRRPGLSGNPVKGCSAPGITTGFFGSGAGQMQLSFKKFPAGRSSRKASVSIRV